MNGNEEEIIGFRLQKAANDLEAARALSTLGHYDAAMNRLYYAAFHAVSALLFKQDIKHKAHSGAKTMFELHFVKTGLMAVKWGKFYASLFHDRNDSDYEDFAVFTADDVVPLIPETDEFIGLIKALIQEN